MSLFDKLKNIRSVVNKTTWKWKVNEKTKVELWENLESQKYQEIINLLKKTGHRGLHGQYT